MDHSTPEQRILDAAVELFANCGYSGASTRDIARRAQVNEASVYRYFASKRELFTASLARELQSVHAQLDSLHRINAENPPAAIRHLFRLISDIVTQRPELMRLLQFSALEFGGAMKPVYRKHLGEIVRAAMKHLRRWPEQPSLPRFHAETAVLSFIASVVAAQNFYPLFARAPLAVAATKMLTDVYAQLWYSALSHDESAQQAPTTARPRRTLR